MEECVSELGAFHLGLALAVMFQVVQFLFLPAHYVLGGYWVLHAKGKRGLLWSPGVRGFIWCKRMELNSDTTHFIEIGNNRERRGRLLILYLLQVKAHVYLHIFLSLQSISSRFHHFKKVQVHNVLMIVTTLERLRGLTSSLSVSRTSSRFTTPKADTKT